jgi:hypothetical protein
MRFFVGLDIWNADISAEAGFKTPRRSVRQLCLAFLPMDYVRYIHFFEPRVGSQIFVETAPIWGRYNTPWPLFPTR